jgi:hypothetical protein
MGDIAFHFNTFKLLNSMATGKKMRVNIPSNKKDLLDLAAKVNAKHLADGTASPLLLLQDITWATEGAKIAIALAKHDEAETLKLAMEQAYRERDLIMQNTEQVVRNSRDLLTGVNRSNMKRLGDWGFSIDDSPRAKKVVAAKA